eukprot:jgi/Mesen1/3202/ME000185S02344
MMVSTSMVLPTRAKGESWWGRSFSGSRAPRVPFTQGFPPEHRGGPGVRASSQAAGPAGPSGRSAGAAGTRQQSRNFVWPDTKRPRICILGGGFGGLFTALKLESLVWTPGTRPQIVIVDQQDRFVFKPLLYELLTREVDQWEIAPRFTDLLAGTDVRFLRDTVKSVTAPPAAGGAETTGHVMLASGMDVSYDWLVLALGAETRMSFVPGAQELALPFATLADALRVNEKLTQLERARFAPDAAPIRVAVVGAGYSGVELASTIQQRLGSRGRVQVVDPADDICASGVKGNRDAARKVLDERNVELLLGQLVKSIERAHPPSSSPSSSSPDHTPSSPSASRHDSVILNLEDVRASAGGGDGIDLPAGSSWTRQVETDLVLWTVGTKATVPSGGPAGSDGDAGSSPFPLTGRGQADTEATLRVRSQPHMFALGDSAGVLDESGKAFPATAQVAFQQADYVGWNLWSAINNRPLAPFKYMHLGEMMTLGTNDAVVSVGSIEGLTFDGQLAHTARKLAYLARLPTNEHKLKVGLSWLTKSAIDTAASIQGSIASLVGARTS